jgi:pyroglutamyl-peptidase
MRPTILLTGFGPFPGVPENASSRLATRLAEAAAPAFPGFEVAASALPTEWHAAPACLAELMAELDPVLAIHFGVSRRATGFAVEARGRNVAAMLPDAVGQTPPTSCIAADGPDELATNLPAHLIVARLRRAGLPAYVSRDAGTYLCNTLLYTALDSVRRSGTPRRNGFVHIPESLARAPETGPPVSRAAPLDWSRAVRGGLEIIAASLGREPVARTQAG